MVLVSSQCRSATTGPTKWRATYIQMLVDIELERTGKQRYGDKTPLNVFHMDELDEMFPDAKFVHIIRDGRAVAASLLERQRVDSRFIGKDWAPINGAEAAKSWVESVYAARHYGSNHPPQQYHEIRYEDFTCRRHEVVQEIFSFIGEELEDCVCQIRDKFFIQPREWRKTLTEPELYSFMSVESAVELLTELGYTNY